MLKIRDWISPKSSMLSPSARARQNDQNITGRHSAQATRVEIVLQDIMRNTC